MTGAVSLGMVLAVAAPAGPQRGLSDAIAVEPGATCLRAESLIERVEGWLRTDQVDARLSIKVVGDPQEARVAAFSVYDGTSLLSEREFRPGPAKCANFESVVALAVALAIDASLLDNLGVRAKDPAPAPRVAPRPAPPRSTTPSRPTPTDASERSQPPAKGVAVGLGIVPQAFAGVVPRGGFGGTLRVEVRWPRLLGLRVGALAIHTFNVPVPPSPGRVDTTIVAGRADVCVGSVRRRLRFGGCIGPAAGALFARARDLPISTHTTAPWAAGVLGGELRVELTPRVALGIDLDLWLAFVQPVLRVRDADDQVAASRALPLAGGSLGVGPVISLR